MDKKFAIVIVSLILIVGAGFLTYHFVFSQNEVELNSTINTTHNESLSNIETKIEKPILDYTLPVEKITEYMNELYGYREISTSALPIFKSINNATESWIWNRVEQKLSKENSSELYTYSEIEKVKKELFGSKLTKAFPTAGTETLHYDSLTKKYSFLGTGLKEEKNAFIISSIENTDNLYLVTIIEYLIDYTDINKTLSDETLKSYDAYLKTINDKLIKTYSVSLDAKSDIVTSNIDTIEKDIEKFVTDNETNFTKKLITLEHDKVTNKFYVQKTEKI